MHKYLNDKILNNINLSYFSFNKISYYIMDLFTVYGYIRIYIRI